MREIHRSRRLRPRDHFTGPRTSDGDDDDLVFDERTFQENLIERSNKNTNRTSATFDETMTLTAMENKQARVMPSSSDQSSLLLYSISSTPKPTAISDDLTPLTTTTHATPLTALTDSNAKQTESTTVKIDLTRLSSTDTLASASINSDHGHMPHFSLDHRLPSSIVSDHVKTNLTLVDDAEASMRSVVSCNESLLDSEQFSCRKHAPCSTMTDIGDGDSTAIPSESGMESMPLPSTTNVDSSHVRRGWNAPVMSDRSKLLVACSFLGFIAVIVFLLIVLWRAQWP